MSVARARGGASPSSSGKRRRRRTASYVGLLILALVLADGATGWLLWVSAHRRAPLAAGFLATLPPQLLAHAWSRWVVDVGVLTDLHVWAGYLLTGLTILKLWAVWWLLTSWFPRRFGRRRLRFEKAAAWAMPIVYGVVLVTGVALDQRFMPAWGHDTLRDIHLWSSEVSVPLTLWHVIRYLPTAWRIVRHDARRI